MAEKLKDGKCACCKGGMGGAYFIGFIGAAVYFISNSVGFWAGVVGFLKALVLVCVRCLRIVEVLGDVIIKEGGNLTAFKAFLH